MLRIVTQSQPTYANYARNKEIRNFELINQSMILLTCFIFSSTSGTKSRRQAAINTPPAKQEAKLRTFFHLQEGRLYYYYKREDYRSSTGVKKNILKHTLRQIKA